MSGWEKLPTIDDYVDWRTRLVGYAEVQEALKNNVWDGKLDWKNFMRELFGEERASEVTNEPTA